MGVKIYTKGGDGGETALVGGDRVGKDHLRVDTYGTVDELNAVVGLARSHAGDFSRLETLDLVQGLLLELGSELATPAGEKRQTKLGAEDVTWLEGEIDRAEDALPALTSFVLPGGTPLAAHLHLARTVCRRAERRCVTLRKVEPDTRAVLVRLLNRLSDLLFVLARLANHEAGAGDTPWHTRA